MLMDRLADSLSKEGFITDEEREIVRFGLESLEGNLLCIVLILAIGICYKRVGEALLLWPLLFSLRKNAGGYHASTKIRCLIMSAVMLIAAFAAFTIVEGMMMFYGICVMVTGCVIWALAPVDNPSKVLDVLEHNVYQRRTRIILGVESVIFVISFCCQWEMATRSVCMTYFIVSLSLLLGKIKLCVCNKYDL